MVLIDKNNVDFIEKTPIDYLHKKNFDVFDKIDHYFRWVFTPIIENFGNAKHFNFAGP